MTKTEYAQYIASPEWQEKRKEALALSDNRCFNCGMPRWLASIVYDQDLHVHHLNYQNVGNEQAEEDLQVLCRRCHEIETFGRSSLKELKRTKCEKCYERHYDPYSGRCSTCSRLNDPPELYFLLSVNEEGHASRAVEAIEAACHVLYGRKVEAEKVVSFVQAIFDKIDKRKQQAQNEAGHHEMD
jgi:hypothetical protein